MDAKGGEKNGVEILNCWVLGMKEGLQTIAKGKISRGGSPMKKRGSKGGEHGVINPIGPQLNTVLPCQAASSY